MRFFCITLFLLPRIMPVPSVAGAVPVDSGYVAVFEEVWQIVEEHFYDPDFRGVDWGAMQERYAPLAAAAHTPEAFADVVNEMLGHLQTSHTRLYTRYDPAYHQLFDIFKAGSLGKQIPNLYPESEVRYPGIGLLTSVIDDEVYVKGVLAGAPAEAAGFLVGDRLVSVDGAPFLPIRSFEGKEGREVSVLIQRTQGPGGRRTLRVIPERLNPQELFLKALTESIRVIEEDGKKIGYAHVWSYAGEAYHEVLQEELAWGQLKEADALILDLRDGWGGANPSYLNLFNARVPRMTQTMRGGEPLEIDFQWRKPVVMLVNEGVRSGKEVLAFGFKKYGIGKVIGTRTAGAVVAGRPFLLKNGMLLYLAVADVQVEGERLEGNGVAPDIEVPFALPYAEGDDPQLKQAIKTLLQDL